MTPQSVLGCPACGMHITGTESECPRCHHKFEDGIRFECPFCGGLIPKGSKRCPTCQIDLMTFPGSTQQSVEQTADTILDELIKLESSLIKQDEKKYCCPGCSWLLAGSEQKCPRCGRALVDDTGVACPICFAPIQKDSKECPRCGAILRVEKAPATAPPPVPPPPQPAEDVIAEKKALKELEELLTCRYCGTAVNMEATTCPKCGGSLVTKPAPAPPAAETPTDAAATEALETLGEIEQSLGAKTRKLRTGKVTTVEKGGPSGRGLSNGLGQTNGTSMVNGRSKINGTSRVNGTGAINGRSLVNGKGLSNGLRAKASAYTERRRGHLLKWQFIAVLVAIVIVIPAVIFLTRTSPSAPISIDGDFEDWSGIPKFGANTLSGSPSIDIVEWATEEDGESVFLYARTQQAPMAANEPESFYLFIDLDGSASTGYLASGMGADYMLKFEGWNGSIESAVLQERSAGADQYDWNSWVDAGAASVRMDGASIEAGTTLPDPPSSSTRYMLMSKNSNDGSSTSFIAPSEGGLLVVRLEPSAEVADDGIVPVAGSIAMMRERFICQGEAGTVSAVTPALSGAVLASSIQSFSLSPNGERLVNVMVNASAAIPAQMISVDIPASGISSTFSEIQVIGGKVSAYAAAAPQGIVIDGAFADWAGRITQDQDFPPVQIPSIDINSTGNYSTTQSSFFYVSVKGELAQGCYVPAVVKKPSGSGDGGQGTPTRKTGEDILRVYIDSDTSTGSGETIICDAKVIGADHKIEIRGMNGQIMSSTFWNRTAGGWIQSSTDVQTAKDYSRIEISIDAILINGSSDIDSVVETTCWKDEFDRASYDPSGTRTLTARTSGNAHIESWVDGISTSPWATSMSYQRKIFWDGTNFWSFYFDGTDTVHKYSTTGTAWSGRGAVFQTSGVNETSIWYDSANNIVYAVGDTGTASANVYIQKGTVSPATHLITWAASDSTLATSTNNLAGKNTFISRDTNGYLWILSANQTQTTPPKFQLTAFKSTAADSITSWTYSGQMLSNPGTDKEARGSIVPGLGGSMWGIYIDGGNIASRKYTGTWQTPQTGIFSAGGQGRNTEIAPPSVVVDSLGVVHVVYGTARKVGQLTLPTIEYVHNDTGATTYTTAVDLDEYIPNDVGDIYPTISLDTSTNYLYVFWLRTDTTGVGKEIMGRKCVSGTWSNLTVGSETSYSKQHLTSIYSASGEIRMCWQWTQNTTGTIHVMFDMIPEFSDFVLPLIFIAVVCAISRWRVRRTDQ